MNKIYSQHSHYPLLIASVVCGLLFVGCAGSASHKVVTANQADDPSLTCHEIDNEIRKAQSIIDEVNKDKEDLSGKDVVDGILWFPFNLIAKHENYSSALEAADRRIEKLNGIKKEKQCSHLTHEQTVSQQHTD